MVSINEEFKAARAAKAAIDALLTTSPKSAALATLKKANHAAILNLSSGGALNEARSNVGIALSNVIHSQPTPEKIDKAKFGNRSLDKGIRSIASGVNMLAGCCC
jgi:hypothetical protein